MRETPQPLSSAPPLGSWGLPFPPSSRLSSRPQGGGKDFGGNCGLYGFIYNILKKSKICMKNIRLHPSPPVLAFAPFSCLKKKQKKQKKTHFCTGRGRVGNPLTTIKPRREARGVAVCLSLRPRCRSTLYHWGAPWTPRHGKKWPDLPHEATPFRSSPKLQTWLLRASGADGGGVRAVLLCHFCVLRRQLRLVLNSR